MKLKYLAALSVLAAATAHAGIPVVGGPVRLPNTAQLLQLAEQHQVLALQYQQLAQAQVKQTQQGQPQPAQPQLKNEAVREGTNGTRVVEEPPLPRGSSSPTTPQSLWAPGVVSPTYVIDSNQGLRECGWPWLDKGCRAYVPKQDRRERAWVLKLNGQWMKCPHRDTAKGCVSHSDFPNMVLQD